MTNDFFLQKNFYLKNKVTKKKKRKKSFDLKKLI